VPEDPFRDIVNHERSCLLGPARPLKSAPNYSIATQISFSHESSRSKQWGTALELRRQLPTTLFCLCLPCLPSVSHSAVSLFRRHWGPKVERQFRIESTGKRPERNKCKLTSMKHEGIMLFLLREQLQYRLTSK
jgi:hypothetical protein